jgi:hypothetical protein
MVFALLGVPSSLYKLWKGIGWFAYPGLLIGTLGIGTLLFD